MCFRSYKNCELKVNLWWVEALARKKSAFFVTFILFWKKFVKYMGFISMYSALNKLSYLYLLLHVKKPYFIHFCCLFLKSSKAFSISLTGSIFGDFQENIR